MKFGVREICNVTFKAKSDMIVGNRKFLKDEPVIYFDSAKTSTTEGSTTTVYAQGGRGNPRLVTWEGEKILTFTFEDALISPLGMSILMGAGLVDSTVYQHHVLIKTIATADEGGEVHLDISQELLEIQTTEEAALSLSVPNEKTGITLFVYNTDSLGMEFGQRVNNVTVADNIITSTDTENGFKEGQYYYVDGYVEIRGTELTIEANKFSDAFYIEAETLFRREKDNFDRAAQLIFPKGKISSNFTLSMANSGDPSTFTFTVDAMEDVVKGSNKKVLCQINIVD